MMQGHRSYSAPSPLSGHELGTGDLAEEAGAVRMAVVEAASDE